MKSITIEITAHIPKKRNIPAVTKVIRTVYPTTKSAEKLYTIGICPNLYARIYTISADQSAIALNEHAKTQMADTF